jgi:GNAT superfamily N-acetyltransferase
MTSARTADCVAGCGDIDVQHDPPRDPLADLAVPAGWQAMELRQDDAPRLQRFFDANPEYWITVSGQAADPGEAAHELADRPPEGWPYTRLWHLGWAPEGGELEAVAQTVADLLQPRVWHLGLFIVATAHHGSGMAHALYRALEAWARGRGAAWLRLAVVDGNARAERFWRRQGYQRLVQRHGIPAGPRFNSVWVMAKSLSGAPLDDYLALVPRDQPVQAPQSPGAPVDLLGAVPVALADDPPVAPPIAADLSTDVPR